MTGQRWELYRLLSEPVRLRLLALAEEEELAIGELAELLGESQPNVSRHAAPLKQAGLLSVRKQGTRTLVRVAEEAAADPVVADALASGRALCDADGSLGRVADVIRARDQVAREFFSRSQDEEAAEVEISRPPLLLAAYLAALAPLLADRGLAVDAGTGDGGLLDVLAPVFERVIAIDRSEPQLERARARVGLRAYTNVELVHGELDAPNVRDAARNADAVFAVRMLHHAPQPERVVRMLGELCRPGGSVIILDYARHDDEKMRDQADLWLGFEPEELGRFARSAGLEGARVSRVPAPRGVDGHLPWQMMVAKRGQSLSHSVIPKPHFRKGDTMPPAGTAGASTIAPPPNGAPNRDKNKKSSR